MCVYISLSLHIYIYIYIYIHIFQALVLAPTREIALQIADEIKRLGWHSGKPAGSVRQQQR